MHHSVPSRPAAARVPDPEPEAELIPLVLPGPPGEVPPRVPQPSAPEASTGEPPAEEEDEFDETIVVVRGASRTDWKLVDIDGQTFPLDRQNVLGRKPAQSVEGAQLIALSDSERVLSRTHARIEVDDAGLWVTDLGSTNGTDVVDESGAFIECAPHERFAIAEKQSLSFGGRQVSFIGPGSPTTQD